jgi:hypothetical protein
MRFCAMKLMGTARLHNLAQCDAAEFIGAVAALHAELKAAVWDGPKALLESYPSAKVEGRRVEIALDGAHCVTLLVNYETGHMLVESAGPRVTRAKGGKRK